MKPIQLLILAGGVGKRMRPLRLCKSLINFIGKPLIEYIREDWRKTGVNDFKIVCASEYLKEIRACLKGGGKFFAQKKPLGMADAVLRVKLDKSKPLIIVNGEDLLDNEAYKNFLSRIKKTRPLVLLTGLYSEKYFPGGYFKLKNKQIKGITEKPGEGKEPSNFINLVLHYFEKPADFFNYLKNSSSQKDDLYEAALNKMIKDEKAVELFEYHGYWQSLKYPWHILSMMEVFFKYRFKNRIADKVEISPKAVIKGPVIIEKGVKIYEGACIVGPSYIGKNTIVGNQVLIRGSMIGDNCLVGFASEIARSWIGNNCRFHTNYIGDSVLQENISFGSGAVTANLRLDEEEIKIQSNERISTGRKKLGSIIAGNVRLGVNASLMPGVMIGKNSIIGPGLVLNHHLKENSFCILKQNYLQMKTNKRKVKIG